jgi:hypothetical protein
LDCMYHGHDEARSDQTFLSCSQFLPTYQWATSFSHILRQSQHAQMCFSYPEYLSASPWPSIPSLISIPVLSIAADFAQVQSNRSQVLRTMRYSAAQKINRSRNTCTCFEMGADHSACLVASSVGATHHTHMCTIRVALIVFVFVFLIFLHEIRRQITS